ncbi:2,3-bisphosphoglycerate-dependent phosphoglycerate mutase [Rhodococcoides fascians]|uniref:2,3-bisphosphoglycerate-dependent phosphoglycerate mutase n=1 Tax=Rhodococcoides fascians TaxID=1828 RepID=UPI000AE90528|nr:2,3-bisphosphoglycerate-dependent phosphoglycerate mutase [Rhodococcus fascians]
MAAAFDLILLRHGESTWNADDRFAGWVDVPLTDVGRAEAVCAGRSIDKTGVLPDVVHTSFLRRAISTADLVLDTVDRHWIPVRRTWRLNERHYGALQGCGRQDIRSRFGADQFRRWRRSFDEAPPPIEPDSLYGQDRDVRYVESGVDVPTSESLDDVSARLLPHWQASVVPDLRSGKTVLIVAHGNVLRTLLIHLTGTPRSEAEGIQIATGKPMWLTLDNAMRPI